MLCVYGHLVHIKVVNNGIEAGVKIIEKIDNLNTMVVSYSLIIVKPLEVSFLPREQ